MTHWLKMYVTGVLSAAFGALMAALFAYVSDRPSCR